MSLNTLDVLVLLKIVAKGSEPWSQVSLGYELRVAQSQVHAALKRVEQARLYSSASKCVLRQSLAEFLIHGVKYAFPACRGVATRGIPTGYAAQPLRDLIAQPDAPPPVWPDPDGPARGYTFEPIDRRAPKAALADAKLHELLVIVDAIRDGRPRETGLAVDLLRERLGSGE
jgi:hypothetical protein